MQGNPHPTTTRILVVMTDTDHVDHGMGDAIGYADFWPSMEHSDITKACHNRKWKVQAIINDNHLTNSSNLYPNQLHPHSFSCKEYRFPFPSSARTISSYLIVRR